MNRYFIAGTSLLTALLLSSCLTSNYVKPNAAGSVSAGKVAPAPAPARDPWSVVLVTVPKGQAAPPESTDSDEMAPLIQKMSGKQPKRMVAKRKVVKKKAPVKRKVAKAKTAT
jgi:hypothetical protein